MTFKHTYVTENKEIVNIPNGSAAYIIGEKGFNIKKIKELSGAKISIVENTKAIIYGTFLQRKKAKIHIEESALKYTSRPTFGSFLLATDDINRFGSKNIRYRFVEFVDDDKNIMINHLCTQKYIMERIGEPNTSRSTDKLADKTSDKNYKTMDTFYKAYRTQSALGSGSFGTLDKLDECLKTIFVDLYDLGTNPCKSRCQIQLHLFFGRQTFHRVNPQETLSVDDFCEIKRHSEDIGTLFTHNYPSIYENIGIISEKFKLKPDISNKDNRSIDIIYVDSDQQRKKIKLFWDKKEELWKIEKVVKNMKRHAIISIISGTNTPDLRFIVKSKCDVFVNPKLKKIINDLQMKKSIPDENGMLFKLSDFEGKLDCISVRQKIKNCYSNDKFRIIKVLETQEVRGYDQFTTKHVSLKSLCWQQDDRKVTKANFNNDTSSIHEAIKFAREVAKLVDTFKN
ncbi:13424_t:CDS:2 [Acaulospora morrowiae]|uniref:13424_t:CDS:1 n=1 Tax=Acaulospora morrowiae TaxID=94023 RepID=A0A9N8Z7C5_9GLOM|nr:13424_t:CDS:2 [Acaulospora morrowiae]